MPHSPIEGPTTLPLTQVNVPPMVQKTPQGLNGNISATGSPYVADDDVILTAHDVPPNR